MTPLAFVLIVSALVLGFAVISAAVTNAGRATVPVNRTSVSRSPRAGSAGFGTGVVKK